MADVRSVEVDGRLASFGRSSGRRVSVHGLQTPAIRGCGQAACPTSMVAVMQATHVRPRDDLARGRRLDGPTHRRILTQRQMRAPVMVLVDVRSQYALQ